MRTIPSLTEYQTTYNVPLAANERDALRTLVSSMTISPSIGLEGCYDLTPGGTVGVLRVGDLQVHIESRLRVENVLFLVSYALDPKAWRPDPASVAPDVHLFEALIPTFAHHTNEALRRGLLHGYRTTDDAHTTVRGRIRFADQLRNRPGLSLPVEITYDDFTADIVENRLLRAATERLLRLPLRHAPSRATLIDLREQFSMVTSTTYPPGRVPEPHWTRLNARYRPAVQIARLILDGVALDITAGSITGTGVLLDMASVFENFVHAALRESLGLTPRTFPQGAAGLKLRLSDKRISLKPDLSWWIDDTCVFVGDCKYKRTKVESVPNADLYQLLAYTTALNLPNGLLIYASGQHPGGTYPVRNSNKHLSIKTLDLAGSPSQVLAQIGALAEQIKRLAKLAWVSHIAA